MTRYEELLRAAAIARRQAQLAPPELGAELNRIADEYEDEATGEHCRLMSAALSRPRARSRGSAAA